MYEQRPNTDEESWKAWEAETCATLTIDRTDLHMTLVRLSSMGLLQLVTAQNNERGFSLEIPEYGESGTYMVTATFDKLMEFVRPQT
jgi:hypothetical protein